jgi:hypothetical protein
MQTTWSLNEENAKLFFSRPGFTPFLQTFDLPMTSSGSHQAQ